MTLHNDMVKEVYIEMRETALLSEYEIFAGCKKDDLIEYHSTMGRHIRNKYGLWKNPWTPEPDSNGFDCSPDHPDSVSMKVIEDIWRYINKID
jgi:hypothetical protein